MLSKILWLVGAIWFPFFYAFQNIKTLLTRDVGQELHRLPLNQQSIDYLDRQLERILELMKITDDSTKCSKESGMYYDKEGNEISLEQCCDYLEDPEYRFVQQDHVDKLLVSTVWLGVDYGFSIKGSGIFETMVFDADMESLEQCLYNTLEEAKRGHQSFLDLAKEGMIPETKNSENGELECGQ